MKRTPWYLIGLFPLLLSCGTTDPDQSLFALSAAWAGQILTLNQQLSFGEMQITLTGQRDGQVEEYEGEGTIFGSRFNSRMRQISVEYDTTTAQVEMTIIDFPITGAVLTGTVNGTTMSLQDTVFCICTIQLTR